MATTSVRNDGDAISARPQFAPPQACRHERPLANALAFWDLSSADKIDSEGRDIAALAEPI
jgi:hypothetical protein